MSMVAPDHVARADALVAAARNAAASTHAAAEEARHHRDELVRAAGGGPAYADRAYRSFAQAIAPPFEPGSTPVGEAEKRGAYGLVDSADETYAAMLNAANAAAAAVAQAQAHREKLG